eukprot:CAMPEP_0204208370 /NCGR_PEP_ID=MMETSP0361-20130328/72453_1 /ASSEMBLY_ACC=CAM_ASM_000343 /TAXON_ID=268821 /ORGANISM="Scrippsiella Hangoei, Strain SHTV-5" /LENGTH=51 /DNA_ID=CAMNT_0051172159 /DNA_START=59 /DNA_END=211 /DNA_ORIENTATION=+
MAKEVDEGTMTFAFLSAFLDLGHDPLRAKADQCALLEGTPVHWISKANFCP